MTKKLYYADPLAAAYMANEFGVKYQSEIKMDWLSAQSYTSRGNFSRINKEYYIHPDSLDIFQPKEGDRNIDGLIYTNGQWIGLGYASSAYIYENRDIDKRDNKPFFTPIEEEKK